MTSKTSLHRLIFILRWIRESPVQPFNELLQRYKMEMYIKFPDFPDRAEDFSKRTLQRDIIELKEIYGICIEYDRKLNGYKLTDKPPSSRILEYLLDTMEMYQIMQMKTISDSVLFPDDRKARGSEHMMFLLKMISDRRKIQFVYKKFDGEPASLRTVNPLALKEFKNRWYLLAFEDGSPKVKTYGIDRMEGFKRLSSHFDPENAEDWKAQFETVFGITAGNPDEVRRVVLSFRPVQGRYVLALPLHSSQKIILENESEIRISLKIFINHDIKMELLSFGPEVEVISPKALRTEISRMLKNGWQRYEAENGRKIDKKSKRLKDS